MRRSSRRSSLPSRCGAALIAVALGLAASGAVVRPGGARFGPQALAAGDGRDEARRLLVEGATLYEQGELAAALEKFEAAYAAFPSPKIFFNFGQAFRGLARNVEAIEAFTRFLDEARDADEAVRTLARRYLAELEPTVGRLVIDPATPGAELFVDGRSEGTLPLPRPVLLAPGPHQITIEKNGLVPLARRLEIAAGAQAVVAARLAPAPPRAPVGGLLVAPPPAPPPPLHARWWVWTIAGVVAAGAATTYLLTRRPAPFECGPTCSGTVTVGGP